MKAKELNIGSDYAFQYNYAKSRDTFSYTRAGAIQRIRVEETGVPVPRIVKGGREIIDRKVLVRHINGFGNDTFTTNVDPADIVMPWEQWEAKEAKRQAKQDADHQVWLEETAKEQELSDSLYAKLMELGISPAGVAKANARGEKHEGETTFNFTPQALAHLMGFIGE